METLFGFDTMPNCKYNSGLALFYELKDTKKYLSKHFRFCFTNSRAKKWMSEYDDIRLALDKKLNIQQTLIERVNIKDFQKMYAEAINGERKLLNELDSEFDKFKTVVDQTRQTDSALVCYDGMSLWVVAQRDDIDYYIHTFAKDYLALFKVYDLIRKNKFDKARKKAKRYWKKHKYCLVSDYWHLCILMCDLRINMPSKLGNYERDYTSLDSYKDGVFFMKGENKQCLLKLARDNLANIR